LIEAMKHNQIIGGFNCWSTSFISNLYQRVTS